MQRNLLGKAKCLERRFSHLANHVLQRGGFPLVRTSCSHRRLRTPFKESQREKTRITIQEKDVHTESSTILLSLPTKHTHTPRKLLLTCHTLCNYVHGKPVKQLSIESFHSLFDLPITYSVFNPPPQSIACELWSTCPEFQLARQRSALVLVV